jgi:hypothetical protein
MAKWLFAVVGRHFPVKQPGSSTERKVHFACLISPQVGALATFANPATPEGGLTSWQGGSVLESSLPTMSHVFAGSGLMMAKFV